MNTSKTRNRMNTASLWISFLGFAVLAFVAGDMWGWEGALALAFSSGLTSSIILSLNRRLESQELARLRSEMAKISEILRLSGVEYPTGARGVADLAQFAEEPRDQD